MSMVGRALLVCALVACGGSKGSTTSTPTEPVIKTVADRILTLLPDGAQVVVEIDLARLRANPVVGPLVTSVLEGDAKVDLPGAVEMSPLIKADTVVLASYGVGTSAAAMVTIIATKELVPHSVSLGEGLVALGPVEWTAQLEARAALAGIADATAKPKIFAAKDLIELRDRAMPQGAPGAAVRVTARLSFDARVALARSTGIETPPAQISIWADVVDDMALIIDAEISDPGGDKPAKGKGTPQQRLERGVRGMLGAIALQPEVKLLGLAPTLDGAKVIVRGSWLRTIIAVGPDRLGRAIVRAKAFLETMNAPPPPEPVVKPGAAS